MSISERIQSLRRKMAEKGIDIYIVPSADFHQSEYVGDYFKAREFMTGFTGSAGTAVFTKDEAHLWTDGRYFIQAASQLMGSGIHLQKMGEAGTPTIQEYIKAALPKGGCLGFDGRTIGVSAGKLYEEIVSEKAGSVYYKEDLVDEIWKDRPALPNGRVYRLEETYAGISSAEKLAGLRSKMQEFHADIHILTSLDDIGWLFNIRGNDVAYCPMLLSYVMIDDDRIVLYADENKFDEKLLLDLRQLQVSIRPYDQIYQDIQELTECKSVLIDSARLNYAMYRNIPEKVKMIESENPTIMMKAVKNAVEIENIRKAHIKDGVAFTKFMYWLKTNIGKIPLTEMDVSDKLEEYRAQQENSMGPSFDPISAYKEHAAIVHYSATQDTNKALAPEGLLLMDTGGHYLEGSTDITRTMALGKVSKEEKADFTYVACGMLYLANAVFPKGCTGMALDYAARAPLWRRHKDFNHGTGHGVGYLGNIHEPPATINWKNRGGNLRPLEAGMVITDEPGIYIEDSHGIRTENELLVCEDVGNEFGQFMNFEILTMAPIDLDAIEPKLMNEDERKMLNAYHKKVYDTISPLLEVNEKEWLKTYTREI